MEVKGRITGADQFVVTRNEILHAPNVPDAWVLALVEVSPGGPFGDGVRYLRQPFGTAVHLPFDTTATVLSWPDYRIAGRRRRDPAPCTGAVAGAAGVAFPAVPDGAGRRGRRAMRR